MPRLADPRHLLKHDLLVTLMNVNVVFCGDERATKPVTVDRTRARPRLVRSNSERIINGGDTLEVAYLRRHFAHH